MYEQGRREMKNIGVALLTTNQVIDAVKRSESKQT
jgi:hypothetical protein